MNIKILVGLIAASALLFTACSSRSDKITEPEKPQQQIIKEENNDFVDQGISELIAETKTMEKYEFQSEGEREQLEQICMKVPDGNWSDANNIEPDRLYMHYYILRLDEYIHEVGIDNIDTVTVEKAIDKDDFDKEYFLIPDEEVEGYLQSILNINIETIQKIDKSFGMKDDFIDKRFYYFCTCYGFGGGYLFGIEDCWKKDNTFIFRLTTLEDEFLGQGEKYIKLEYHSLDNYKYLSEYKRDI